MRTRGFLTVGRKVLASAVSAAMVIAFAPTVSLAAESDVAENTTTGVTYGSIAEAIEKASAEETIALLRDAAEETIVVSKSLTIDLAGHVWTGRAASGSTVSRALQVKQGTVELKSSSETGMITNADSTDTSSSVIRVGDDGALSEGASPAAAGLLVNSNVTVSSTSTHGVMVYGSSTAETLEVRGSIDVSAEGKNAIVGDKDDATSTSITIQSGATVSSKNGYAIYHPQSGTLNINGCVEGLGGIEAKAGTIRIAADGPASVSATAGITSHFQNDYGPSTRGYAIAAVANAAFQGPAVTIGGSTDVNGTEIPNRCEVTGVVGVVADHSEGGNASISIINGEFSRDPASYVANGSAMSMSPSYQFPYSVAEKPDQAADPAVPANVHWGAQEGDDPEYYPPYALGFTSTSNSEGRYAVEILKKQADGTYKRVFYTESDHHRGGAGEVSMNYFFHSAVMELGQAGASGTYRFRVAELYSGSTASPFAESGEYAYTAPKSTLGAATDLHWDAKKPTIARFKLPENATGALVTLYKKNNSGFATSGSIAFVGFASAVSDGSMYEEVDFGSENHPMFTETGEYAFTVQPLSFDLNSHFDGAEGDKSPIMSMTMLASDIKSSVENGSNYGKDFLSSATTEKKETIGNAMLADDALRAAIDSKESEYISHNPVEVLPPSVTGLDIDPSLIDVIGAAYNADLSNASSQDKAKVELTLSPVSTERQIEDPSLKSVIQFSMDLIQGGTTLNKTGGLDVPVCITLPVPSGMTNLRIRHYHNGADPQYKDIRPVVFTVGTQTFARFFVTSFSDFVILADKDSGTNDPGTTNPPATDPGTSGGSGGIIIVPPAPSEPEQPVEPEQPETPAEPEQPAEPETPEVSGPTVGTTATVSGLTVKVSANGQVKVTGLSKAAKAKKTLTIPGTIKVKGKACKVVGIKSGLFKGSKATTLVIKTKLLTKSSIKNCLKNSNVKTVKVKVSSSKKTNKAYIAKYKKIFTSKICGKKVTVSL